MADREQVIVSAASGAPADEVRMSFGDHLEELRRRIILALAGLACAIVVCLFFAQVLVGMLCQPLLVALRMAGLPPQLYQEQVPQTFMIYMEMSLLAGLILASPWIIYQIWKFVAAGLYPHERRYVRRYGMLSLALFLAGAAFVYFIATPFALKYFVEFSQDFTPPDPGFLTPVQRMLYNRPLADETTSRPGDAEGPWLPRLSQPPPNRDSCSPMWINAQTGEINYYDSAGRVRSVASGGSGRSLVAPWFNLADYLQFILSMMLVSGLAFQMPLVILFLAATGIVEADAMARQRRLVILVIVIVAAVMSPTTDAISLCLLSLPMLGLFEFGLVLARRAERRSRASNVRQ